MELEAGGSKIGSDAGSILGVWLEWKAGGSETARACLAAGGAWRDAALNSPVFMSMIMIMIMMVMIMIKMMMTMTMMVLVRWDLNKCLKTS